jgi:hypothetical protein
MGSDRANPGAPNLNGPNGGPQAQAVEQKQWPGYVTMSFSDHQNSVKSHPKIGEMEFQRV